MYMVVRRKPIFTGEAMLALPGITIYTHNGLGMYVCRYMCKIYMLIKPMCLNHQIKYLLEESADSSHIIV